MSVNERTQAHEWFAKADTDLTSARLLADISGPAETICFLAQQGAEKYLKGFLVWYRTPFRKVHDLLEILNVCRNVDNLAAHSSILIWPRRSASEPNRNSANVSGELSCGFAPAKTMTDSTPTTSLTITDALLEAVVKRLVGAFAPVLVILFGSYAEGRATADSDLDLLVVTEQPLSQKERPERTQGLFRDMPLPPIQVMTISRQEFEETRQVIGGIAYPATKYGRVIYQKP